MNPNTPSHEEVTRRAEEIWREKGCPSDRDEEIWLEAERQLSSRSATPSPSGGAQDRGNGNSQPVTTGGSSSTPADPEPAQSGATEQKTPPPSPIQAEAESTQLKKSSRAPKSPTKTAPKAPPASTGKPLWNKPHSS